MRRMQNEEMKSQVYFKHDGVYNNNTLSLSPSRFVMKQQELINRYALCLTRLREAAREVESLRDENATLISLNRELSEQVRLMLINGSTSSELFEMMNRFENMSFGGGSSGEEERSDDVERNWLPKSISVRSNGYLKLTHPPTMTRTVTRPRISSSLNPAQKVYVKGGKKEEEALELEVYNQGMFKTELCNKWQETGACPYADHCQFAHGIEELRPVIRHPRYKTEVCRMILSGDICPYGHRCHFRHALTHHEKLMANLTSPTNT